MSQAIPTAGIFCLRVDQEVSEQKNEYGYRDAFHSGEGRGAQYNHTHQVFMESLQLIQMWKLIYFQYSGDATSIAIPSM